MSRFSDSTSSMRHPEPYGQRSPRPRFSNGLLNSVDHTIAPLDLGLTGIATSTLAHHAKRTPRRHKRSLPWNNLLIELRGYNLIGHPSSVESRKTPSPTPVTWPWSAGDAVIIRTDKLSRSIPVSSGAACQLAGPPAEAAGSWGWGVDEVPTTRPAEHRLLGRWHRRPPRS